MSGGSSPLTRGKHARGAEETRTTRLIPAHAGKTTARDELGYPREAHPRSRGENGQLLKRLFRAEGSSPLTRGKLQVLTRTASVRLAHPRSRGENQIPLTTRVIVAGSSPLTRGKPRVTPTRVGSSGLIPAHAGKTSDRDYRGCRPAAHPRSRGENLIGAVRTFVVTGSSPLTRGKPLSPDRSSVMIRLIPAHAGKTRPGPGQCDQTAAHPRSRGENCDVVRAVFARLGSSPLTRGKPSCTACPARLSRLIPAHAGKTAPCLRRA